MKSDADLAAAVQQLQRGRLPEHGIVVGPCLLHRWRSQNPLIPAKVLPVGLQFATHEFLKANEIGSRAFKQGEGQGSTMFPGVGAIPVRDSSTDIEGHDPKGHHEAPLPTLRSQKHLLAAGSLSS